MANLSKLSSAIKSKGGNQIALRRVNYDGTPITAEVFFDAGHREKFQLTFEKALDEFRAEDGNVVATESGDVSTELKVTLMQSDSNTLNFIANETDNTFYSVVMHTGEGNLNTNQYLYIPLSRIQTKLDVTYPARRPELTITPLMTVATWNAASLTAGSITAWSPTPLALSASLSGNVGSYWKFAEV